MENLTSKQNHFINNSIDSVNKSKAVFRVLWLSYFTPPKMKKGDLTYSYLL